MRECDFDTEEAQRIYGDKTPEELEKMWEEMKKKALLERQKNNDN